MFRNIFYKIARFVLSIYLKIIYKPIVIYYDSIPKKDGCILISNHSKNVDFISMGITTKRVVHFLAKDTLFKGFTKYILNWCGVIPVNRKIKDKSVVQKSIELLKKDEIIGIFPEGTFNKTNSILAPFKIGAIKFSYESGKPIIPIAIITPYKRNKLTIIVGKKYYVKSNNLTLENRKLMDILEKMILNNRGVI